MPFGLVKVSEIDKSPKQISSGQVISVEELRKLALATIEQYLLSNPFPFQLNENAESAYQMTIEWIKKFKLIPDERIFLKSLKSKFIDLTAGAYPNCSSEKLILISDWITFLYFFEELKDNL